MDDGYEGNVKDGWENVRRAFEENLAEGLDIGATVCIYYRGEPVVDLSGGWWDQSSKTKLYTNDTLQLIYSTSKGVVAAAVAVCVARGLLEYEAPVARYWPEFAAGGKQDITVHDVMAHRAGLPCVREQLTLDDVLDWSRMTTLLASQRPFWESGTKHGYHAVTIGFLAGELVRRVDPKHRSFGAFVREELDPHFYIGVPDDQVESRVAPLIRKEINFDELLPPMDEITELTNTCNGAFPIDLRGPNIFNEARLHRAELPAANGITNARSLARIYALLIGDVHETNGETTKRLIDEKTLLKATTCATPIDEPDCTLFGLHTRFAMGFQTYGDFLDVLGEGVFGHNGSGGSCGLAFPARHLAFAYVCNQLDLSVHKIDPRSVRVLEAAQRVIDAEEKT